MLEFIKQPPELHFEGIPSKDLSSALFTACALNRPISLENCFIANYEQTENGSFKFTLLIEKAIIHNAEKPKKFTKMKFIAKNNEITESDQHLKENHGTKSLLL